MLKKRFLTYSEAISALCVSAETFRQAVEFDLWKSLPAFVLARPDGLLVKIVGTGVTSEASNIHDSTTYRVTLPSGASFGFFDSHGLDDELTNILDSDLCQSESGYPATFEATGYFRLFPGELKSVAEEGETSGHTCMAPQSWWSAEGIPRNAKGTPTIRLQTVPTNDVRFGNKRWAIEDILFRTDDIEGLAHGSGQRSAEEAEIGRASARAENNLLRVIAALAKEAKIDIGEGKGGAATIEAAVSAAGFSGPKEKTIRAILRQAREVT